MTRQNVKSDLTFTNMFAKLKGNQANNCQSAVLPCPVDNPINQFYKIGKQVGSVGPELSWKVFEATRKSDDQVSAYINFIAGRGFRKG